MTAPPAEPGPDTGGQPASPQELEDAEDTAAVLEWKVRDADGQTTFVPADEARRWLGIHG